MNNEQYFGIFSDRTSVAVEFQAGSGNPWNDTFEIAPSFPGDHQIIIAVYEYEDYSGDAFVLFEEDGQLYEVHGGHCSCYGLEGQWEPEPTSWDLLIDRVEKADRWDSPLSSWHAHSPQANKYYRGLLKSHS